MLDYWNNLLQGSSCLVNSVWLHDLMFTSARLLDNIKISNKKFKYKINNYLLLIVSTKTSTIALCDFFVNQKILWYFFYHKFLHNQFLWAHAKKFKIPLCQKKETEVLSIYFYIHFYGTYNYHLLLLFIVTY